MIDIRELDFGPLVLALYCYCGNEKENMSSFTYFKDSKDIA